MRMLISATAAALFVVVGPALAAGPAHWPAWRGPDGTGVGDATGIPDEWSATKNVRWKVAIDGHGMATPIIWGDRIFLLTAVDTAPKSAPNAAPDPQRPRGQGQGRGRRGGRRGGRGGRRGPPPTLHKFVVLCLDRETGRKVWEQTAVEQLPHEGFHPQFGSFASGSPATDGEHLFVNFGSRGVYAYDMDGNLAWKTDLAKMSTRNAFGEGVSPVVYGDKLVIQHDHEGASYITVLDKKTGREIWKTARDVRSTWSTPAVVAVNGQPQVIALGSPDVISYDLATGKERWRCGGMTQNPIPTVVVGHGMVYAMTGYRGNALRAIRLGYTGDLTNNTKAIAWSLERGTPYVPSPLLYGDELYLLRDRGTIGCYDAKTGKPHYEETRIPGLNNARFHTSPVGAGDRIYCLSMDGTCAVLKRGKKLEVVAINKIDEEFSASPAVAAGDLFLRGDKHLYCIGTN